MGVLINGIEYGWSDIKVNFLGRTVQGITSIKYGNKRDKQNNYGAGPDPVSRGRGNNVPNCSMSLSMKEMEAIQNAIPRGKGIESIPPFPIIVSYDPEDGSSPIITDRILAAEFTGKEREVKQGDGEIIHECEMIVGKIEWNV